MKLIRLSNQQQSVRYEVFPHWLNLEFRAFYNDAALNVYNLSWYIRDEEKSWL